MINKRYKIIKRLGRGRSQVYLCSDKYYPSKLFTIKIISNSSSVKELKSFRNEYFLLKKLHYPNIVQVYEYGSILIIDQKDILDSEIAEGSKFFISDYIEGITLDKFEGRNDLDTIKTIVEQICTVLFYLHQSNYIYYDLNPENLIVQIIDDNISVHFFDFYLTKFIPNNDPYEVQGTASYIAPEIIMLSKVDHRTDLYSLGMLLYYLIYNKFPFDTKNELNIYKSNIENEFEFQKKPGYEDLINVAEKLLRKSPEDRYKSTLEVLGDLNIQITKDHKDYWNPIKTFCGRKELIYEINSLIFNKNSQKVIVIRGEEGSGKSLLLEEINYNLSSSILIKSSDINSIYPFWKLLLNHIYYSEQIFNNIDDNFKIEITGLLENDTFEFIEKLKSIFFRISRDNNFELLIDDFSKYDVFSIEILKEIIPIFQVNGIKIVISDENELSIISDLINDFETFNLKPFSKENVSECIERSYFKYFPKDKLSIYIKENADLLPGNVYNFIKNLVFLGMIEYDHNKIEIKNTKNIDKNISYSFHEIYEIRTKHIAADQLKIINLLSLFQICLDPKSISLLSGFTHEKIDKILVELKNKGIIINSNISLNPDFSSSGLKGFIYKNIQDKKSLHLETAQNIVKLIPDFNKIECARQFELADDFIQCYKILKEELKIAEDKSAKSYQRKILIKLLSLPLSPDEIVEVKYKLANVLFEIGEIKICLNLIEELLEKELHEDLNLELLIQKGKSLNRLSLFEDGIALLESIVPKIKIESRKQEIFIELADAKLYLNDYDSVFSICRGVIDEKQSRDESKARAYNLLGLVELNRSSNFSGAIYNFQYASSIYQKANLPFQIAGIELNIGNIINIKGNLTEAQKHWQASYEINETIGNLEHEAKLVMNYGIYYFQRQLFEKSVLQYKRAENIFSSLGYKIDRGLALINLGEVYLNICEYDLSLNCLSQAGKIFREMENTDEEAEVFFLIGQCYFYLGDKDSLIETIDLFESHANNNSTKKHKNYISYLKHLLSFIKEDWETLINEINDLMHLLLMENVRESYFYYSKSNALFVRALINTENFDLAIRQLNDKNFLKICDQNVVQKAEREYLLGLIAEKNNKFNFGPSIDFYNNAIELIEDQSILELTWEINFALAKFYYERGNLKKFGEYYSITKSLLNFISKKITSRSTREIYLRTMNRGSAIKTLENFENSVNE